ncbi:hypothetical protein NXS19_004179 [Fusarium pseudograminearum]|nr:hypothetical protein NXS19_004179 [Fusarium pseudograminearum]
MLMLPGARTWQAISKLERGHSLAYSWLVIEVTCSALTYVNNKIDADEISGYTAIYLNNGNNIHSSALHTHATPRRTCVISYSITISISHNLTILPYPLNLIKIGFSD